jgi:hypothetical protein
MRACATLSAACNVRTTAMSHAYRELARSAARNAQAEAPAAARNVATSAECDGIMSGCAGKIRPVKEISEVRAGARLPPPRRKDLNA